ncbi:MAG: hypothetical protein ACKO86_16580, partial [Dolichospermum sp.]
PIIQYWVEKTLSPQGLQLWQTLNHKSTCLSCAWGTGGQKGGFVNEAGEYLQRCAKPDMLKYTCKELVSQDRLHVSIYSTKFVATSAASEFSVAMFF